ncbi:hypothetical protein IGI04_014646 [Brassica rapa subsp. trilocularis]|uniref:Uncharacterized protein n=1 Tax=Brassica rapa subsp. trilocularis TaxID=1813537 RepID=A0ABQ7MMS9_BRACM|nr:hypothetical protein IGI04_014646 [Brassica rapa subsp. trilocularis]
MIGRRRLVIVVLSPALVVDKPGDPALRVVPYGYGLVYVVSALVAVRKEKLLGLEDGGRSQTWGQGPGTQRQGPGPEGRDLEDGTWNNLFMEYFSPTVCPLFSGFICTCAQCERICSLVGDDLVNTLRVDITVVREQVGPDETLPLRWGFAGVGRKFDAEARNACIKGDATAHTQLGPDFSFLFLRISGSTNRVEECMGQDPGILRARILARLRIRRMSRVTKTRRPKLRILMLDSTGLACSSRARKGSVASCVVPGLNLEAGWTLVKQPVACMDLGPGTLRLFGAVSSFASSRYSLGSLKDGTRCVRLLNLEFRDASHSTFRRQHPGIERNRGTASESKDVVGTRRSFLELGGCPRPKDCLLEPGG